MRLEAAVQAVFVTSLLILAVLPFLHGYLASTSEQTKRLENELEQNTQEAVRALNKLKATSTIFDHFVEERQKRRDQRLAEQERLVLEKAEAESKSRRANEEHEAQVPPAQDNKLGRIRDRIRKEQLVISETPIEKGAVGKYAEAHNGALPILIVCHNRARELGETLDALLKLRNVDPQLILVVQDGTMEAVRAKVVERSLALIQNTELQTKGWAEGGRRIAWHYRFSLNAVFEKFADAPAVIVLEDDLRVSPDFIDWFIAAGGVLEKDPTLWCVSAWNDNGFNNIILEPDGPYRTKRTELFPGLGWLLLRSEYDLNLRQQWPDDQWDWYVRGVYQRKERECLYPEYPRTFHAGRTGTFVNENDQKAIFDRMAKNERSNLDWQGPEAIHSLHMSILNNYDARIESLVRSEEAIHVKQAFEFEKIVEKAAKTAAPVVLWYDADPDPKLEKRVMRFAKYFGIWHQLLRSSHEGTHEIYFRKVRVLLINTFNPKQVHSSWFTSYAHRSRYALWKPDDIPAFDPEEFMTLVNQRLPENIFAADTYGESCSTTCTKRNMRCDSNLLSQINLCGVMKQHFSCTTCDFSMGDDQPCFVNPDAPMDKLPKTCLVNTAGTFSCDGKHDLTRRLCACA